MNLIQNHLHPLLVHIPLVMPAITAFLMIIGAALGNASIRRVAIAVAALAALSGFLAAETGEMAHEALHSTLSESAHEAVEAHEEAAERAAYVLDGALLILVLLEWRGRGRKPIAWTSALVSIAAVVPVIFAGHSGATVVHVYGVGVEIVPLSASGNMEPGTAMSPDNHAHHELPHADAPGTATEISGAVTASVPAPDMHLAPPPSTPAQGHEHHDHEHDK